MAWVRIPPLPRSFVSPRRRLLFAAESRRRGAGLPSITSQSAELRWAQRRSPPPSGFGMQAGRRSAALAMRPRVRPCPHRPPLTAVRVPLAPLRLLPAHSRSALPAVPSQRPGGREGGLWECFEAGRLSPGRRGSAEPQGSTAPGSRSFTFLFIFPHMQ